jgi:flagellar protein FlbB
MARSSIGAGPRIIVLLLLVIVLVFGGLLWFDFLGFINAKETLSPILSLIGQRQPTKIEEVEAPALLEEQRVSKQWEALQLRAEELDKREAELNQKEQELQQKMEALQEREKSIEEKEKSLNAKTRLYENKKANLEQIANYLTGMPPENAVDIMQNMDDQQLIDILRTVDRVAAEAGEQSLVPYWFSLMAQEAPDRAARLQRKMIKKPSSENGG